MITHYTTDFVEIIKKLREHYTLRQIADLAGLSSEGHVHDICSGRNQKISYDIGVRLISEYQRILKSEKRKKNDTQRI